MEYITKTRCTKKEAARSKQYLQEKQYNKIKLERK